MPDFYGTDIRKLERRLDDLIEQLRARGVLDPLPPPPVKVIPPQVSYVITCDPFKPSRNHPYTLGLTFDCPGCKKKNENVMVHVDGPGITVLKCSCGQSVSLDIQFKPTRDITSVGLSQSFMGR
jgi:hypothetical protein